MVKVQPTEYKNTGTPTTNHTSRAPKRATRAAAKALIPGFFAKSSRADPDALLLPIMGGKLVTTPTSTKANSPAMVHKEP